MTWFPEACRELTRRGAQLLCQPAAFGGTQTLEIMRVRSMENHLLSVTANRIGRETSGDLTVDFRGESQIVDCHGRDFSAQGTSQGLLSPPKPRTREEAALAKAPSQIPLLGELELAVLERLWTVSDADVHEMHAVVGKKRESSPNTVGSALERLVQEGPFESREGVPRLPLSGDDGPRHISSAQSGGGCRRPQVTH